MDARQTPLTSSFESGNGEKVFYRHWKAASKPKAVAVLVHGFNSHSGYYQWVAEQLTADNYDTYAPDLRGRGNSDGERFYIEDYNSFVADIDKMVDIAKSENSGLPAFLIGHSAGGVLSSVYALDHQDKLKGFVCESFAFQVPAPDFALAVLKGLSHIAPHAHVLKLKNEDFSRDAQVVEAMNADPLIAHEVQPTKTVQQLVLADERLKAEMSKIALPIFIIHGTLDKATRPEGSRLFYETVSSTDKTLRLYEGHFHDLLNDKDKEVVMSDILAWLNSHV